MATRRAGSILSKRHTATGTPRPSTAAVAASVGMPMRCPEESAVRKAAEANAAVALAACVKAFCADR